MGILPGEERAGRGAIQQRALLVRMMEAAAARRKQGQLTTQSWSGRGTPQDREGAGARTHQEMQCWSPRRRWGHERPHAAASRKRTAATRFDKRSFWPAAQTARAQTTQVTTNQRTEEWQISPFGHRVADCPLQAQRHRCRMTAQGIGVDGQIARHGHRHNRWRGQRARSTRQVAEKGNPRRATEST